MGEAWQLASKVFHHSAYLGTLNNAWFAITELSKDPEFLSKQKLIDFEENLKESHKFLIKIKNILELLSQKDGLSLIAEESDVVAIAERLTDSRPLLRPKEILEKISKAIQELDQTLEYKRPKKIENLNWILGRLIKILRSEVEHDKEIFWTSPGWKTSSR